MKRLPIALALAAFTLVGATSAYAQSVEIGGSVVNQNVNANGNANVASGDDSVAKQSIGAISDASIEGSVVTQNVNANGNANVASGEQSVACQEIGVIGDVGGASAGGNFLGGDSSC